MIAVGLLLLSVVVSIVVSSFILPVVEVAMTAWVRFYTAFVPPDLRERRRSEVLRDMFEQKKSCLEENYRPSEIAPKLLYRWAIGLPCDITWCAPFILPQTSHKIVVWSDSLRHTKIPAALIAGVAILGLMNLSFFTSSDGQSFFTWLFANIIGIVMTVLLWKRKHPFTSRIFQAWMWLSIAAGIVVMAWMTVHFQLYTSMTFKILMLAMVTVMPTIIVIDKSWRQRFFRGRWWLIVICWIPIIAGAFTGSWFIAHDIKPLLEIWAVIALLGIMLLIGYVGLTLASFALCWAGIRGSAGGLRLMASGIRRLR